MVFLLAALRALITNKRNEETELRDLDSDGPYVHPIQTILNQIKLAAVVVLVFGEIALDGSGGGFAGGGIGNLRGDIELKLFPTLVVGVKFVNDVDELV